MLSDGRAHGTLNIETRQFRPFEHFIDARVKLFEWSDVQQHLEKMFDKITPLQPKIGELAFECSFHKQVYLENDDLAFLDRLAEIGFRGWIEIELHHPDRLSERFRYRLRKGRLHKETGITAFVCTLGPLRQERMQRELEVEAQLLEAITRIAQWEPNNAKPNIALEDFSEFLIKRAVEILSASNREKKRI